MSEIRPIDSFHLQQNINSIQQRVQKSSIDSEEYKALFIQLDQLQHKVIELTKDATPFNKPHLEELNQRLITLFGELEDQHMRSQVDRLTKQSKEIAQGLQKGISYYGIEDKVEALRHDLAAFEENYRPAHNEKQSVQEARQIVEQFYLRQGTNFQSNLIEIDIHPSPSTTTSSGENFDETCSLFDTACLFFKQKNRNAMKEYYQLSIQTRLQVGDHLRKLGGDPDKLLDHTPLVLAQACIATAHQLEDCSEGYWSAEKIEELITDIAMMDIGL